MSPSEPTAGSLQSLAMLLGELRRGYPSQAAMGPDLAVVLAPSDGFRATVDNPLFLNLLLATG